MKCNSFWKTINSMSQLQLASRIDAIKPNDRIYFRKGDVHYPRYISSAVESLSDMYCYSEPNDIVSIVTKRQYYSLFGVKSRTSPTLRERSKRG